MRSLLERTTHRPLFVGVVHLSPTPGAPGFAGSMGAFLEEAVADAHALAEGGVDALIVENFGDTPFFRDEVPSETVAAMTLAVATVRAASELPVGVNVLRNDARSGVGICAATGASFLRINVHTGAMWTDQGLVEGRAAETLRERERLCPEAILLADVHVKHARPVGEESLEEAADETWSRGRADVLIVSGQRTGSPPGVDELTRVKERLPEAPVWIGSGLDAENGAELLRHADGALVGSWLKRDGDVAAPVDPERVRRLRRIFDAASGA